MTIDLINTQCRKISGSVVSGHKIACQHITQNLAELKNITGENLFPGSMNIILYEPVIFKSCFGEFFDFKTRMIWPGWINGLGKVWLYRWRGCPLHIVEILSSEKIREKLNLNDGDLLTINTSNSICTKISVFDQLTYLILWSYRKGWYYQKSYYVNSWLVDYARRKLRFKQNL